MSGIERRISRPIIFFILSLLKIIAIVLSFFLGSKYSAKEVTAEDQASAVVPVWTTVEQRIISDSINFQGTAKPASTTPLVTAVDSETNVVLLLGQQAGDYLSPGDFLGKISGKSFFVLEGPLPLYRDLRKGDKGEDVQYLQASLARIGYSNPQNGRVDQQTLDAVSNLYRSENIEIPAEGIETIEYKNFIAMPAGKNLVLSTAKIGDSVSAGSPLVTLEKTEPYIEAHVPYAEIEKITEGQQLDLTTSKGEGTARVQEIGSFVSGNENQGATYTVRIQADDVSLLVTDQVFTLSTKAAKDETPSVPSNAIKEDSEGTYLLVQDTDSESGSSKLLVKVLRSADGYTAIDGDIAEGTKVLLQ